MEREILHQYTRVVIIRMRRTVFVGGGSYDETVVDTDLGSALETLGALELAKRDSRIMAHEELVAEGLPPFPELTLEE